MGISCCDNGANIEQTLGIVTEIERYAIHDGIGIRSTMFFKGCPLSCKWCCNPETQHFSPELGLFMDKCIGCGSCERACPHQAIEIREGQMCTNRLLCQKCDSSVIFPCVCACYTGARSMLGKKYTARQVYEELSRDRAFYESSNGGITISGGEPLAQPDFCYAILKLCHEGWLNTAIETCGAGTIEDYERILPFLDMVFIDVKSVNPEKYRAWIGVEPQRQMESLRYLSHECNKRGIALTARTPVIPGFNDNDQDIEQIAGFLEENEVQSVELLPYHKLGRSKYVAIGRKYDLKDTEPPAEESMARFNEILQAHHLLACHY